jgi:L-cysteine/cystine lyase
MDEKLTALRADLPALQAQVYLNTGTSGPMPRRVHAAMVGELERQLTQGRAGMAHFGEMFRVKDELRAELGALLGCSTLEVAVTGSTTEGMNLVTLGVNWQPGDEAITTNLEHAGALLPLFAARDRFGITVKVADVVSCPERAAAIIEKLITPRTKLISVSHVSFITGAVLPVREICDVAHRHGVLVLVDGAQSFAAMDVNVKALGCDFYAGPGQKWVCGPEGVGVLYASAEAVSQVSVTFAAYFTVDKYSYGGMLPHAGARKFEQGTAQIAVLAGFLDALRWFASDVGPAWAFGRIRNLAGSARSALMEVPGVRVLTPADAAGLVTFQVAGKTPEAVVEALTKAGIVARTVPEPGGIRIATGFYNTEAEIETVVRAVASL